METDRQGAAGTSDADVEGTVSMANVAVQHGGQDLSNSDESEIAALRCTVRDVSGQEADTLADILLSLGAESARYLKSQTQNIPETQSASGV